MKAVNNYTEHQLTWKRASSKGHPFELRKDDEILARITLHGRLQQQAHIETSYGNWTSTQKAFSQIITICDTASQNEIAYVQRHINGKATLTMANGSEYKWTNTGFWRGEWTWFTSEKIPILHIVKGRQVRIENTVCDLFDLHLLAVLAWLLNRVQNDDAAYVAAAIVPVF